MRGLDLEEVLYFVAKNISLPLVLLMDGWQESTEDPMTCGFQESFCKVDLEATRRAPYFTE